VKNAIRAAFVPMIVSALAAGCAQTPRRDPPAALSPDIEGSREPEIPDAASPDQALSVLFSYPVTEGVLYSPFGARRGGGTRRHSGADISAPRGTPVQAAGAGEVIFAGFGYQGSAAWGRVVLIDHGQGWTTLYAHLSVIEVAVGDRLEGGEQIGRIGQTGNATGPHLHIEVRENGHAQDPASLIPGIAAGS